MLPSRPVASEGPAVAAAAPPFLPASPLSSPPLPHCHAPLHQPQWPTLTALCSFLAVSRSPTAAWAAAAGVTAAVRLLRRADTQVSEAGRGPGGEGAAACQLLLRRHVSAQNCIAVRGQLSVHFLLSFARRCFSMCAAHPPRHAAGSASLPDGDRALIVAVAGGAVGGFSSRPAAVAPVAPPDSPAAPNRSSFAALHRPSAAVHRHCISFPSQPEIQSWLLSQRSPRLSQARHCDRVPLSNLRLLNLAAAAAPWGSGPSWRSRAQPVPAPPSSVRLERSAAPICNRDGAGCRRGRASAPESNPAESASLLRSSPPQPGGAL